MQEGLHSFRDYDTNLQHIYIVDTCASKYSFVVMNGELAAWLFYNHLEVHIPNANDEHSSIGTEENNSFGLYTLSKHLPYLTYLNTWEPVSLLSPVLKEYPLQEVDMICIRHLYDLLTRFESRMWYGKLPIAERFRQTIPSFHGKIPNESLTRAVCYLYNRHVTLENRLELVFHAGISQYLVKGLPKEEN